MKNILYLTFYFEPDLCAGSFRNTPLIKELAILSKGKASIDVLTTLPNRYNTFNAEAPEFEKRDNYSVYRVRIPKHQSGMKDQILSFQKYYREVLKNTKQKKYDLVVASSSRLFTAYLGYQIAKKRKIPLYLDIRDIFYDTIEDVLSNGLSKSLSLPIIKQIEKKTFGYAKHINLISGGFKNYFKRYSQADYTYFPNGIDEEFIVNTKSTPHTELEKKKIRTIVYAGNIGEGQGLHKIIPQAAQKLIYTHQFHIIGDGGARQKLEDEIQKLELENIMLSKPIRRAELMEIYKQADFLFVHLNNYKAFEKVLPSKIFELATFSQPLIAGVSGYAANFIQENIENSILFEPCNADQLVDKLSNFNYTRLNRENFIEKFKRKNINKEMALSILSYL